MNAQTQTPKQRLAVILTLCVLMFSLGMAVMSMISGAARARIDWNNQQTYANYQAAVDTANQTIATLTAQRDTCQANFTGGTVLWDSSAELSPSSITRNLSPTANIVAALIGNVQSVTHPRWVIPARIKPSLIGGVEGARCEYIGNDGKVLSDKPCAVEMAGNLPQ